MHDEREWRFSQRLRFFDRRACVQRWQRRRLRRTVRAAREQAHLGAVADDISARLAAIFLKNANGVRPVVAGTDLYLRPDLAEMIPFHEYFHGDTGRGLGASHQTGWTGLVADLLLRSTAGRDRFDIESLAAQSPGGTQSPGRAV